ncbi:MULTISPECIES: flagellar protein FliT [unclassified Burkholderia]|uniref:flagellar protein FliT n=1 Tax=unclassified Burkholderia TaxID=2613784 RepID=UPI000F56B8BA|nr:MULTISPECIES: flagellar protein FliT [unclassified Burkholderia]RQR43920.1 flagellar protein FliT [Burkholderia sp. Bp9131]RQR75923.1 flagellar protein FliT [Burkholderia sp. Bp9015]RQR97499.1 flagellar protein FliT [Burkholderia sp. Bp8994]RQS32392.1 flagellar protein FliT [Burkholderia sp. Bp8995]RQS39478.1 flagellar protein FliT [Burkholderia sp. Bp8990]
MDQPTLLARVWQLTQAIEHAATMADWCGAARLAEARSPLLMSLSAPQTPDALAIIRRIQAIDTAIAADAETTQRELHAEFQAALGRTEAAGRYQQIAQL